MVVGAVADHAGLDPQVAVEVDETVGQGRNTPIHLGIVPAGCDRLGVTSADER